MLLSFLRDVLPLINEILTAGIVVTVSSMLLYNISRGILNNWINRTTGILLSAVTLVFIGDTIISLGPPTIFSLNAWLRFQWIGIALVPAALFHLSHVLLSTTGRISRGRRRLGMGLLYALAIAFMTAAAGTDQVVHSASFTPVPYLKAGPWFPVYVLYAVSASALALHNVGRARARCLTHSTQRRMTYMLYSILTPIVGVFPYTSLLSTPPANDGVFWLLVTLSNVGVILMLSFMAYPLSFFGGEVPDRVIKTQLLEFFLRGPFVGVIVLSVIIGLPRAGRVVGIPGEELMPLAAVFSLIFLEWIVNRALPLLENRLIYAQDAAEIRQIRTLNNRLLTRSDIDQLLEGILASACDYLQVAGAFAASITPDGPVLEQSIGSTEVIASALASPDFGSALAQLAQDCPPPAASKPSVSQTSSVIAWQQFWLIPFWNGANESGNGRTLFGLMGVQMRTHQPALTGEERHVLSRLAERAAHTLRDMRIQAEVFGRLEALIPEMEAIDQLRWITRYRGEPGETAEHIVGQPGFEAKVKEALGHYWGGPRLTKSALQKLRVTQERLPAYDGNPANALRAVLLEAIEQLCPEGVRSMTAAEWTLYNILELRFIQGRKVRDVARRLAISESDLYRKQRIAIGEVARILTDMEQNTDSPTAPPE